MQSQSKHPSIAIVAIARLENNYIKEWIEYHLNLGFSHIYIYDNSFEDEEKIMYNNPLVTIIPAYNKVLFQKPAYTESYKKYNSMYDFMCYIDIDEFIELKNNSKIYYYLKRIPERAECIRINWQCYDDNNLIKRNLDVKVVDAFTHKIKVDNLQSKSIVRSKLPNIIFTNPHHPIFENGTQLITYDGNFNEITHFINTKARTHVGHSCIWVPYVSYDNIQLNHYRTKTLDEYMKTKLCRGDADRKNYSRKVSKEFFKYNKKTLEKIQYYNEHKQEYVKNTNSLEELKEE